MYPKISFITVVYNDAVGLQKTLQNLIDARYPNKEIIVIDGNSVDSTPLVALEYADYISHFSSEPDAGIYDAMNKGIAVASGQYVWFVNAGDTVENIETLYDLFTTDHFLADIYYGETVIVGECGSELGLRRKKPPIRLTVGSFREGMLVCHQSFLMRRSLCPLYDLQYRYSADYKWMIDCVRVAKSSVNTGVVLSRFVLGGATSRHHRASLFERFGIMRAEYGLFVALLMHLKFLLYAPFVKKYR